jgi:hypothetical protein
MGRSLQNGLKGIGRFPHGRHHNNRLLFTGEMLPQEIANATDGVGIFHGGTAKLVNGP